MATLVHTTLAWLRKAATGVITKISQQDHARRLDRLADVELQHGHHTAAERLAHAAQAMREVGQ